MIFKISWNDFEAHSRKETIYASNAFSLVKVDAVIPFRSSIAVCHRHFACWGMAIENILVLVFVHHLNVVHAFSLTGDKVQPHCFINSGLNILEIQLVT